MLRALASYFFGGIEDESPEAPIECETREVNDWLVVNLPDQNKDSVNLNDDDDTYEIDDEDVRYAMVDDDPVEVDESEMDLEDDILLSLSFLMPPDTEQPSTELSNKEFVYGTGALEQPCIAKYIEPIMSPSRKELDYEAFLMHKARVLMILRGAVTVRMSDVLHCTDIDDPYVQTILKYVTPTRNPRTIRKNDGNECGGYTGVQKVLDLTPPPMYSKNYVNHCHPEKVFNQELLQRIKELEPAQHAVQWSVKKNLTRGHLNRQNKNYIYETSSKKNRRCNRQRNHSGANNNRKC